jgi:NAD-dependent DNA ligase
MSAKIKNIVELLKAASNAYYNGSDDPILEDDAYDALREELEQLDPQNPFLKQIGAPVFKEQGAVKLPYKMASLNKIKPGTGAVESFRSSSKIQSWVLSEKLDGISVLWDTGNRKLYLRGDGFTGVDVSHYALYLHGLTPRSFNKKWVLRGELVLPKTVDVKGTLRRSWVNGQLHQKTPIPEELGKINFVAYELIEPAGLTREQQFQKMAEEGFEVPWNMVTPIIADNNLSNALIYRRDASNYDIDGIVVGENNIPVKDTSDVVNNPKDMRAFKMPMGDQKAETEVVDIVWSASYQGYWIPRLQIKPVTIGGSRIEFLTGHNARFVLDNQVGKGARIVIRKSGDVIPTLDQVLTPNAEIALPKGVWDGPEESACHLKLAEGEEEHEDVVLKKLEHFAKTLDIPHLGPGQCVKLISASIVTPGDLIKVSYADLVKAIGEGMAKKVFPAIQAQLTKASEMDFMIASSMMPRGVGNSKLKVLFALQADPRLWSNMINTCEGWTSSALKAFYAKLPAYEAWRKTELPSIPYPKLARPKTPPAAVALATKKEFFCFSGFRSAEIQERLEARGHEITSTFSKKTTILVVTDADAVSANTEKVKKAKESGTRILTRDQMMREYLGNS